jgi:hypothetical protein
MKVRAAYWRDKVSFWAFEDLPSKPQPPVSAFRAGVLTGGAHPCAPYATRVRTLQVLEGRLIV